MKYHTVMLSNCSVSISFSTNSNFSPTDSIDSHSNDILLFSVGGLWKHCLHTGLQDSAPPTNSISCDSTVLWVKAAGYVQYTHTAVNLYTFSAKGTKLIMFPNGFRWKVLSRAATITTIPLLASYSAISTMSSKNCP